MKTKQLILEVSIKVIKPTKGIKNTWHEPDGVHEEWIEVEA